MEIQLDLSTAQLIQFVLATVLPVLVGLVTTKVTSSRTKAILLLLLAAVTSLLTEALSALEVGGSFDLGTALLAVIATFVIGVAVQFGLWAPTGVTEKVQAVGVTPPE